MYVRMYKISLTLPKRLFVGGDNYERGQICLGFEKCVCLTVQWCLELRALIHWHVHMTTHFLSSFTLFRTIC